MCLLLTACHVETSDNGDLDGLWQLAYMEDLQTGQVRDCRDDNLSWAFQWHLLVMRGGEEVLFRFQLDGATLTVSNPYLSGRFTETRDDTPVSDPAVLNVYGVYQLEERFQVLQLDDSHMTLQSDRVRLSLRKY